MLRRDKEGSSYQRAPESTALPAPWLETSSLQNCKRVHFCCLLNCFIRFYLKWLYVISFLKLNISKVEGISYVEFHITIIQIT